MKKRNRLARLMLCALLTAAMLTSAVPAMGAALSAPGQLPLSDETIHFTIGVPQSAVIENWKTNKQTVKLENDLNIELEFIELPATESELIQKVELMIMAGGDDLPDIILSGLGGTENLVKYGQMGMIVPTNEYYETLTYYVDEACELTSIPKDEMLKYVTAYDGNIWGVFGYNEHINNMTSRCRLMVYEPWLEKLNISMPQTTDEFADMLRAFVNDDPNGNGKQDEIGIMGFTGGAGNQDLFNVLYPLMNPFIYTQENYYMLREDGTIDFVANKPEWREGLRWIKSLFDEGLIDPLTLTQDGAQLTAVMNSSEDNLVGVVGRISLSNLSATDKRRAEYIIQDPLEGPEGVRQQTYVPAIPRIEMVITKNCENPEAAFRLGDYLGSVEMSVWSRYGEKGVDWVEPEEGDIGVLEDAGFPATVKVISQWGVMQNIWWGQRGPDILPFKYASGIVADNLEFNVSYPLGRSMTKTLEYANYDSMVYGLVFNEEEQETVTEFRSTINDYVLESFARFVTGSLNLDTDWDTYVGEFEKMSLTPYMEAVQSCYDRMNAN